MAHYLFHYCLFVSTNIVVNRYLTIIQDPHTSMLVQNSPLFYSKKEEVCTKKTIALR